jgi:hypothetical protein
MARQRRWTAGLCETDQVRRRRERAEHDQGARHRRDAVDQLERHFDRDPDAEGGDDPPWLRRRGLTLSCVSGNLP